MLKHNLASVQSSLKMNLSGLSEDSTKTPDPPMEKTCFLVVIVIYIPTDCFRNY